MCGKDGDVGSFLISLLFPTVAVSKQDNEHNSCVNMCPMSRISQIAILLVVTPLDGNWFCLLKR